MEVTALHRYPVKSMRGEGLDAADVEPWGLAGDRRWMLVDGGGTAVTAREVNRLLLLVPELTDAGLRITAPDAGVVPLEVAVPDPAHQVPVAIFSSRLTAAAAGGDADRWLTDVLGREVRLVHLDDPARRPTGPGYGEDADVVSFADGYPLLLTNEGSLAALNDQVLAGADHGRDPLPMTRFRPNLVVGGAEAWAEDDWRTIRVGGTDDTDDTDGATFRLVKGCARCVMTTVDPETAEREREPIASLARIRRFDRATWFGVNLVPDTPGATIRVGDRVEVLDAVEPGGGPLR
ncbi:MOSC domain-containing protein [Nocardioides marinquilinus]|uniref:MOSC domain-containing protein n=1 Tax=Nocardioides marinquilinus TaxID=1210400 RepID=A0ABP9Q1G4_9ACTN